MIRGTMTSQDGKTIYCTAEHHKVNVPTPPEHLKHEISRDGMAVEPQKIDTKKDSKL